MATATKGKGKVAPPKARVERSSLTPAQQKKLDGVLGGLASQVKASKDERRKVLDRFGNKYLRWRLGVRGTGPHSHGFDQAQRRTITEAINSAFGIKIERKVRQTPAPGKRAPAKASGNRRGGKGKTTAQLAREQTARAQGGQPIAGTVVVRQGS